MPVTATPTSALSRLGPPAAVGADQEVDMVLGVGGAGGRLAPAPVAARLGECLRDRRFGHAEESQRSSRQSRCAGEDCAHRIVSEGRRPERLQLARRSTRLNSSHQIISYAVFCLKKKKAA